MNDLFENGAAVISADRRYRYFLRREWHSATSRRPCVFVMLNPSTADAETDDPTIRRCIAYARRFGCGSLRVVNLFAYRSPNPADLVAAPDPVGADNREWVMRACENEFEWVGQRCVEHRPLVICAWGSHGGYLGQDETMLGWLEYALVEPMALRMLSSGLPAHPLYLPARLEPLPYNGRHNKGQAA